MSFEDQSDDNLDYDLLGACLSIGYESLNSINFPTKGNKILFEVYARKDDYHHNQIENQDDTSIELSLD